MAACLATAAGISFGEERAAVTGSVADSAGKPVEHATVLVYQAGVKKGYSIYCPTCYTDCGKHAATDAQGNFTIGGLSPDLLFTLLVVREGYAAEYISKVDPAKGPAERAVLKPRPPVQDALQVVRGRVVDGHGRPLRDAVVEQQGIKLRFPNGQMGTSFGPRDWIDQMAVTNEKGEFEIAYGKPAAQMILEASARGMAPKLFTLPTGAERQTMTVTDGAIIRGRLVLDGKPVANAQVGIVTHARRSGTAFSEVLIGTQADGTFAITNVPAGRIWTLYPKMESLAARNIGGSVVNCETKDDGQEVDAGDIQLRPAYTLRGKVTLSDGSAIPPDMHITLSADQAWDTQFAVLGADGSFEFRGLPPGVYEITPAVRGYRQPNGFREVLVQRDVSGFAIRMEP
jgi:hypothetical protein